MLEQRNSKTFNIWSTPGPRLEHVKYILAIGLEILYIIQLMNQLHHKNGTCLRRILQIGIYVNKLIAIIQLFMLSNIFHINSVLYTRPSDPWGITWDHCALFLLILRSSINWFHFFFISLECCYVWVVSGAAGYCFLVCPWFSVHRAFWVNRY